MPNGSAVRSSLVKSVPFIGSRFGGDPQIPGNRQGAVADGLQVVVEGAAAIRAELVEPGVEASEMQELPGSR